MRVWLSLHNAALMRATGSRPDLQGASFQPVFCEFSRGIELTGGGV